MTDTTVPGILGPLTPEQAIAPEKPLGGTVLRGLVWLSGVRWVAQLFTWASTLFIARLLAPEDYGIVAMATILIGFLEIFTDSLGAAVVQARDLTRETAEEIMGATCLFGLIAATGVALSAPGWAVIQGEPRVTPILQVLALVVLLTAIGAIPYCMLNRRLAFEAVARAQFARGLITAAVTLGSAVVLKSYWALVVGSLAGRATFTVMLVWSEPVGLRMPTRGSGTKKLLRFSGLMTSDRFFYQLRSNIDLAIVGARLGSQTLGLYVMAVAIALLPLDKLGSAFAPVAYPAFARLQNDRAALQSFFLALTLGTMAIAIPASVGLIMTADLLVPTVLGEQWLPAVRPLQIAAFFTPLIFHLGIVNPLLNALGRVDLNLRITMWTSLLTIPAVFIGVEGGIVGVAIAAGLVLTTVGLYGEHLAFRLIGLSSRKVARTLLPVLSASAGMALAVLTARSLMPGEWPAVLRLLLNVAVGAGSFVGWSLLFHREAVVTELRALRSTWARA